METTFIYNGKIISTPNLEKKLKRMKISINDIEIIDKPIVKKEEDDEINDLEKVIIKSKLDDISRLCYVKKGTRPSIESILGKQGIYTEKELENMYYEN